MVGYPGSGKSTIADSIGDKYKGLHGDELLTSKKMIKEAEKVITDGFSVVFDATNPTIKKRAEYITIAKNYKLPIRCIVMKTDMIEAMFRNNKRNKVIPKITYYIFRKNYEEPSTDEGFEEVIFLY
jgi:bifunctional polynucleotide phosphatase/kinase